MCKMQRKISRLKKTKRLCQYIFGLVFSASTGTLIGRAIVISCEPHRKNFTEHPEMKIISGIMGVALLLIHIIEKGEKNGL